MSLTLFSPPGVSTGGRPADALISSRTLLGGTKTWARFHDATPGVLTVGPRVADCVVIVSGEHSAGASGHKGLHVLCFFFFFFLQCINTHEQMTIRQM